jgi:hypothetical protein
MPRILDNIELDLLPTLRATLEVANRSDFCVGYFNLRGWKAIDDLVEPWTGGPDRQCRPLVGMQRLPQDELRAAFSLLRAMTSSTTTRALRLKKRLAEEFRSQLTFGVPTNADEVGLRRLAAQLKAGKLVVKLFLGHPLHAKLYLLFRADPINPIVGYLGSSNLTLSGLSHQGELNVDCQTAPAPGPGLWETELRSRARTRVPPSRKRPQDRASIFMRQSPIGSPYKCVSETVKRELRVTSSKVEG